MHLGGHVVLSEILLLIAPAYAKMGLNGHRRIHWRGYREEHESKKGKRGVCFWGLGRKKTIHLNVIAPQGGQETTSTGGPLALRGVLLGFSRSKQHYRGEREKIIQRTHEAVKASAAGKALKEGSTE